MSTRDGDIGQLLTCDRCKVDYDFDDDDAMGFKTKYNLWKWEIFKGIQQPKCLWGDFCSKCATEMTPFVYALRDVVETERANNKLLKAIREQRANNQNDRSTARPTGESHAGCVRRATEPRKGACNQQAFKNYYGLALFGNESCDV